MLDLEQDLIVNYAIASNLNKNVWIVTDEKDGQWSGILVYSFMYSTWTRYNPFIVYASGDNFGFKPE